jgi:hypothetical protein
LNFSNDRRDVFGEAIGIGFTLAMARSRTSASRGLPEDNTSSLGGLQRVFGPLCNHFAFVLCHLPGWEW